MPGEPLYNDQELLRRIATGDESALRALILQYTPVIASVIYPITKSKERTEDIIQDIFIQVWTTRETLPAIRNINGYLYVLSKHHALNAVRSLLREQQRIRKYQEQTNQETTSSSPALDLVEQAIAHLPPQQQRVWILSRREGKKHAEIAAEMQLSKETVKKYIQWANAAIIEFVQARIDLLLAGAFLLPVSSEIIF